MVANLNLIELAMGAKKKSAPQSTKMQQGKERVPAPKMKSHKKKQPAFASADTAKGPVFLTDNDLMTAPIDKMSRDDLSRTLTILESTDTARLPKAKLLRLASVQRMLLLPKFDSDMESTKPVSDEVLTQRVADPAEKTKSLGGGTGNGQKSGSSGGLNLTEFDKLVDVEKVDIQQGAAPAETKKSHSGGTGNSHSWENQIKLQSPKATYDGSGSYIDWVRTISIWASLYTDDNGHLSAKQDRVLGLSLMEAVKGNASKTVFARVSPGEETYSGVMSILKDCFGSNSMPEALEAYRRFVEYKRKGGETLKEYINNFISLHSKSLSTGNDSSDKTLGLMLLEKSMVSAQLMAQIMTTAQTSVNGLVDSKFPRYELVLQMLRTYSDSYETTQHTSGKGNTGKGSKAFFAASGGNQAYDPVGDFFYGGNTSSNAYVGGAGENNRPKPKAKAKSKAGKGTWGGGKGGKDNGNNFWTSKGGKGKGQWGNGFGKGKSKGKGKGQGKGQGKGASKGKGGNGPPVCWAFQEGTCTRGDECRFSHGAGGEKKKTPKAITPRFEELDDSDEPPKKKSKH